MWRSGTTADPAPRLLGVQRLWTVSADDPSAGRRAGITDMLPNAVQALLNQNYTEVYDQRIDGFTIALWVRDRKGQ